MQNVLLYQEYSRRSLLEQPVLRPLSHPTSVSLNINEHDHSVLKV
jgi:hypothetical protein